MASGEINQRRVMWTAEHVTQAGLDNSNAKKFPKGTVMLAMNGQGATRGKVALLGIEAACNQSLAAITGNCTDNLFLFQLLQSSYDHLRALTGDGRSGLNLGLIRSFTIILPPLSEQRAIAAVLDSIDDAIERTDAVIAATEQLRTSLLHELLTRGVSGWHTEWKNVPGIGTIPADWEVVRLGDVAAVKGGVGFPLNRQGRGDGEYPFIKVSDMTLKGNETYIRTANNYVDFKDVSDLGASVFAPGTTVFPKVGAAIATNKKRVLTVPTIIDNNMAGVTVAAVDRCDTRYLYQWFQSIDLLDFANVSAVPSITGSQLKRVSILLPPLPEQRVISGLLDGLDVTISEENKERDGFQLLKESTADVLLTGRGRVGTVAEDAVGKG